MKTKIIKPLFLLPLFAGLVASNGVASPVLAEGSEGTYSNPIQISSVEDLKALREKVSSGSVNSLYYILTNDLDLGNEEWTPIGNQSAPFGSYFNGNGHTISNLKISQSSQDNMGLFGYVKGGSIEKLIVKGSVEGHNNVGGVVGYTLGAVVGCTSYVNVNGTQCVGGVIGLSDELLVDNSNVFYGFANNCYNHGEVYGESNVGGIIGFDRGDGASRSGNYGKVTGVDHVAGVIGDVQKTLDSIFTSPIIDCFNVGEVESFSSAAGITCGTPEEIISSYNAGKVKGNYNVAYAISSSTTPFSVKHCYNSGLIDEGTGEFNGSTSGIENCYSLDETMTSSTNVTSISQAELKLLSSRLGHGYENNATVGRPILSDNKEVPTAYVHVLEYVPEVPATCHSTGVRAQYICHCGCNHTYLDSNAREIADGLNVVIPKLSHSLIETPNADGSTTYHCKNCDYTVTRYAIGSKGSGTVVDPYLIENEAQLLAIDKNIRNDFDTFEGVYFKQIANIEMTNSFNGIGKREKPFKGNYDGQMFYIKGFDTIKGNGLFNELNNATVKNVYLPKGNIKSSTSCGSIAGIAYNSTIENCYSDLKVTGNAFSAVGGIVGTAESCFINACYFGGTIVSSLYGDYTMNVGGFAGISKNCVISHDIFGGKFDKKINSDNVDIVVGKNSSNNDVSFVYNINNSYSQSDSTCPVEWLSVENLVAFLEDNPMFDYAKEPDEAYEGGFYVYDDSITYKSFSNSEMPIFIDIPYGSNNTGTTIGAGNIALICVGSVIVVGGVVLVIFRKKIFKSKSQE